MFRHKNNSRLFERFFHEEVYIWKLSCLETLKLLSQLNLIQKFYSISNLKELVKTGHLPNSIINSFFPIKYKREISIHTLRKRSIIMYKSCNNDQHFGSREQNEKYFEDQDSILYI